MDLEQIVNKIRTAVYGREVRESIAAGMEALNEGKENFSSKISALEKQYANAFLNGEFEYTGLLNWTWSSYETTGRLTSNEIELPQCYLIATIPPGCLMRIGDLSVGNLTSEENRMFSFYNNYSSAYIELLVNEGDDSRQEEVLETFSLKVLNSTKYELIREDTLSEDVSQYVANQNVNNETFKYKDIKVVIENNSSSLLNIFHTLTDGEVNQFIMQAGAPTYYGPIVIEYQLDENGWYTASIYQSANGGIKSTYSTDKMEYCSEINLTGSFKSNTKISVYGRRRI